MKNGWYILNYHDVSWEENPYTRGVGGSVSPDLFQEHVDHLKREAELVSIEDGFSETMKGPKKPMVSFWFDDGLASVRKYAFPILHEHGLSGAISINSRFTERREMFWRFKLSFLQYADGMRFLRSRLRKYGYQLEHSVKDFVLDHFSLDLVREIDEVYTSFTRELDRQDAFRLFDSVEGLKSLWENGWTLANHTSAHYPVSEEVHISQFWEEFEECEQFLQQNFEATKFWVLPFDRGSQSHRLSDIFDSRPHSRLMVFVGNRYNVRLKDNKLYRIAFPQLDGAGMISYLNSIPER